MKTVSTTATSSSVTLNGLQPNTLYYVSVQAIAVNSADNSLISIPRSGRTAIPANDETATNLQNWLDEMQTVTQNMLTVLPQLETTELNSKDRMRLNGSGVRRYGFIKKTLDVSGEFPQFWPAFGDGWNELNDMVQEIEVLRNLMVWARWVARVSQDLFLITSDSAFRLAGSYYASAHDGARRKNPEAQQVYAILKSFWNRPRKPSAEPTEVIEVVVEEPVEVPEAEGQNAE